MGFWDWAWHYNGDSIMATSGNKIIFEASADMMVLMMETGKRVRRLELRLADIEQTDTVKRELLYLETRRGK